MQALSTNLGGNQLVYKNLWLGISVDYPKPIFTTILNLIKKTPRHCLQKHCSKKKIRATELSKCVFVQPPTFYFRLHLHQLNRRYEGVDELVKIAQK